MNFEKALFLDKNNIPCNCMTTKKIPFSKKEIMECHNFKSGEIFKIKVDSFSKPDLFKYMIILDGDALLFNNVNDLSFGTIINNSCNNRERIICNRKTGKYIKSLFNELEDDEYFNILSTHCENDWTINDYIIKKYIDNANLELIYKDQRITLKMYVQVIILTDVDGKASAIETKNDRINAKIFIDPDDRINACTLKSLIEKFEYGKNNSVDLRKLLLEHKSSGKVPYYIKLHMNKKDESK